MVDYRKNTLPFLALTAISCLYLLPLTGQDEQSPAPIMAEAPHRVEGQAIRPEAAPYPLTATRRREASEVPFAENFWTSTLEAGYEIALIENNEANSLRFNFIQTLHFNQEVGLGLGIGYREYGIPLFANLRLVGKLQKVTFVLEGSAGYSFEIADPSGIDGVGLMFNPRVGISFPLRDNQSWQLMVGYTSQHNALVTRSEPPPVNPTLPRIPSIDLLELISLSLSFNL